MGDCCRLCKSFDFHRERERGRQTDRQTDRDRDRGERERVCSTTTRPQKKRKKKKKKKKNLEGEGRDGKSLITEHSLLSIPPPLPLPTHPPTVPVNEKASMADSGVAVLNDACSCGRPGRVKFLQSRTLWLRTRTIMPPPFYVQHHSEIMETCFIGVPHVAQILYFLAVCSPIYRGSVSLAKQTHKHQSPS